MSQLGQEELVHHMEPDETFCPSYTTNHLLA